MDIGTTPTKDPSDLNGNDPQTTNGVSRMVKDHVVAQDGRVFYPCQYCNKVFPIKKSRTLHIKKCSAKDYILSVEEKKTEESGDIPEKASNKIDIKQNIVLKEQMDVSEILSQAKSPPIKLTIRRSNDDNSEHFTVSNSLVLKEKNESNEDFTSLAKRLEKNSVRLIKQAKDSVTSDSSPDEDSDFSETMCKECTQEFSSPIEVLRHARKSHSYPKVLMALSEVKKFYSTKDRTACPICHKPLKTSFRSAFVKHLLTHTNEMKYSCNVCKKKFRRSDHMKAHEKRHVIEK